MANNNPKGPSMYDMTMWERLGIDPKTGLPNRIINDSELKSGIKHALRIKDEQDAVNRYNWFNFPVRLSSQEVERALYYRHSLIFFYFEPLEEFMLMPYAFDSGIDFWGRPIYVHPVPYASGKDDSSKAAVKSQEEYLRSVKLKVIYDVQLVEDYLDEEGNPDENKMKEMLTKSCVIIRDYTPQMSENGTPRANLQDGILDVMSDCIPFSRTALLNSTGVIGVGVEDDTEAASVFGFSERLTNAALNGSKFLPIKKRMGNGDLQELTGGTVAKADEFLQMMQGYNNFRLGLYGLDNNGLYDKKAYVNEMQSGVNNVGLSLQDGLTQRQNACNIINSIWGIMVWCDIAEVVSGADQNLDGNTYDQQDQSGQSSKAPAQTSEGGDEE